MAESRKLGERVTTFAMLLIALVVMGALMRRGLAATRTERVLACPVSAEVAHTHDASCYDAAGALVCPLPELAPHRHTDACYTEIRTLTCGIEESEGHTHDDGCYDEAGTLVCGQEETAGHTHDESCYQVERTLTCGQKELTESHVHGPGCFREMALDDGEPSADENNGESADPADDATVDEAAGTDGDGTDDEASEALPAQFFSQTFEDAEGAFELRVEVEAPAGALPADSSLQATWVDTEALSPRQQEAVRRALEERELDESYAARQAVHIAFATADGREVTPALPVIVTLTSEHVEVTSEPAVVRIDDLTEAERAAQQQVLDEGVTADEAEPFRTAQVVEPLRSDELAHRMLDLAANQLAVELPGPATLVLETVKPADSSVADEASAEEALSEPLPAETPEAADDASPTAPMLRAPYTPAARTGSILDGQATDDANAWQIVSEVYEGNGPANKAYSDDQAVRVQKNVLPTGIENEFLVYLSIDARQAFADYFASATYAATTSNNYHGEQLGGVVTGATGNEGVGVSGTYGATVTFSDKHGNLKTGVANNGPAYFTIVSTKYEVLAEDIPLYWTQAQNTTIYLEIGSARPKKWVMLGVHVKEGQHNTLMLSEEAETLIMSEVAAHASLDAVTDAMGDYIEFLGMDYVTGDLDLADAGNYFDAATDTLHWVPVPKANPEVDIVETGETSEVTLIDWNQGGQPRTVTVKKTTSWALNVAELLYRVRLDVTKPGFASCADNMDSAVDEACSYPTNNGATLTYDGDKTVDFPKPYVRGLLYDLVVKKVDQAGEPLAGATFAVTGSSNTTDRDVASEYLAAADAEALTSDDAGLVVLTGLPWGTYTVRETAAPAGYAPDGQTYVAELCHTTNAGALAPSSLDVTHEILAEWQEGLTVVNPQLTALVSLVKVGADADGALVPLAGATFDYYLNGSLVGSVTTDAEGRLLTDLPLQGTDVYRFVETQAPRGYELAAPFEVELGYVAPGDDGAPGGVTVTAYELDDAGVRTGITHVATTEDGRKFSLLVEDPRLTEVSVRVIKVDIDGNPLADAVFTVQGIGEDDIIWTSAANGWLYDGLLSVGAYVLTETKAPDGYTMLAEPVHLSVTAEGVSYTQADHAGGAPQVAELLDPTQDPSASNPYVVYVYNNPGVILPAAGGLGTQPLLLFGAALMAVAACTLLLTRLRARSE